jgi:hypothetical protein
MVGLNGFGPDLLPGVVEFDQGSGGVEVVGGGAGSSGSDGGFAPLPAFGWGGVVEGAIAAACWVAGSGGGRPCVTG